jgi:CRISPR type III-A-associated RAMP protein Csm4
MYPSLLVKLRPTSPWRIGPATGDRRAVDTLYHSDSLYSALTLAMREFDWLEDWLAATAASAEGPAIRLSSCFPFVDDTLLITPPRNLWPPPPSARVRWKAARFVPLEVVESLLREKRLREDEGWLVDAESECLLPPGKHSRARAPFRVSVRATAAVDRLTGVCGDPQSSACLEFASGAGLWCVAAFASEAVGETWSPRLETCFRLLADSGFGGGRSRGWGHAAQPEFARGRFPGPLVQAPTAGAEPAAEESGEQAPQQAAETVYWLWSLFSPSESDSVDWQRGAYCLVTRRGRMDGARGGGLKKAVRMVGEGSVVFAAAPPQGWAPDVAPEGAAHPAFCNGFALAIPIVWRVPA